MHRKQGQSDFIMKISDIISKKITNSWSKIVVIFRWFISLNRTYHHLGFILIYIHLLVRKAYCTATVGNASLMTPMSPSLKLLLPIYISCKELAPWRYRHSFRTVIYPRRLASKSSIFKLVFKVKSLKSLEPALSSMLLSLRLIYYKVEFSFKACAIYLDPLDPIMLLLRFRWVKIVFLISILDNLRAASSPSLL